MDRRGFGASGDAAGYAIQQEFEDVAAVVEAVAARTGKPVALWGHSYGAGCAMGGAALTGKVHHLVIYEPSLGIAYPAGSIERIEEVVAAGDGETAILAVLVGIVGMTEEEVDALRSSPRWPTLLAGTPTVPRECRAEDSWVYQPGQLDSITATTLLLAGSESPPVLTKAMHQAAAAIPDARIQVLEGHALSPTRPIPPWSPPSSGSSSCRRPSHRPTHLPSEVGPGSRRPDSHKRMINKASKAGG